MSYYTDYSNYTDEHHVDEDETTIPAHGGQWWRGSQAGVTYRNLWNSPITSGVDVASRCYTIQKKINITHPH